MATADGNSRQATGVAAPIARKPTFAELAGKARTLTVDSPAAPSAVAAAAPASAAVHKTLASSVTGFTKKALHIVPRSGGTSDSLAATQDYSVLKFPDCEDTYPLIPFAEYSMINK